MRFAIVYGRVEEPDEAGVVAQVEAAERYAADSDLMIIGEFFDLDVPSVIPWARRPRAQRLLDMVSDPRSDVAALVVPGPAEAFAPGDLLTAVALLTFYSVELHVPGFGVVAGGERRLRSVERNGFALDDEVGRVQRT